MKNHKSDKQIQQLTNQLRNVGPIMAKKLIQANINTPKQLREMGAKKAYLHIHGSGGFCGKFHAAYLYALEGAICNCDWRDISQEKKEDFKAFTEVKKYLF